MNKPQLYCRLNNGLSMPLLGLGVYDMYKEEAEKAVADALEIGYRLIDTAAMYKNEREIGHAIRSSGINRAALFVTTKVANNDQGYDSTLKAFDESARRLSVDYIDLYLIHWPIRGKRANTWKALERLYTERKVKAIGVANYLVPFLEELTSYAAIIPAVNQVEFSPYLYLDELLASCRNRGIQLQSYTPLIRGRKFSDPRLLAIADRYHKSPAQLILRWNIQHQVSAIPKSCNRKRLEENFDIFDFEISPEDMKKLNAFHENFRVVDDPMDYF